MRELTSSGWSPSTDITSLLVFIRNILVEGGALINLDQLEPYSESEARDAFLRVAKQHGWKLD